MSASRLRTAAFGATLLLIAGFAALFRLPDLGNRPMHGDEAVHAYKLQQLRSGEGYRYDPHEYHGPTLNYLTLPALCTSGVRDPGEISEWMLRVVPALAGIALIPLLALVRDGLGRRATLLAALLTALSPAFCFYSRYYIQEMLLVCFTLLTLAAIWRFLRSGGIGWAILAGAGAGLMHATKETCIIALAGLALFAVVAAALLFRSAPDSPARRAWPRGLAAAAVAGLCVSVAWFSSFGANWRGPLDSILTYATYFERAGERGLHDHPWWYYLRLLLLTSYHRGPVWTEAPILALALLATAALCRNGLRSKRNDKDAAPSTPTTAFGLGVVAFTLVTTVVYAALPYKTPWCLLGFWHGWILLAAIGGVWLLAIARSSQLVELALPTAGAVLVAGLLLLAGRARDACFPRYFHMYNPYVYAHPLRQVVEIEALSERLRLAAPGQPRLHVFHENPWPLPWYLRRWSSSGWWESPPDGPLDADLILVDSRLLADVAPRLTNRYVTSFLGLRPDETLAVLVEYDLHTRSLPRAETEGEP